MQLIYEVHTADAADEDASAPRTFRITRDTESLLFRINGMNTTVGKLSIIHRENTGAIGSRVCDCHASASLIILHTDA